jgi:hypothetical protein
MVSILSGGKKSPLSYVNNKKGVKNINEKE